MIIERIIFHVDVNSAYLSWSAADRAQRGVEGPDLLTVPAAVTGDPESRHGVILAKSIPAKAFGIHTGEPTAAALRKCPHLYLIKPDFDLYQRQSEALMTLLRSYAPLVEPVSVDEAFCDFTGTGRLYGDPCVLADRLRAEIRTKLGFTVNIGIADNKLLAKMASDFQKPDRTHTLFPDEIASKMWPLPVGELYGVGRATAEKLEKAAIMTIGDAARAPLAELVRLAGQKGGRYIHEAANGRGDDQVRAEKEAEQSVGNSVTLREDLTPENRDRLLRPTLLSLAESVGSRLRRKGHAGRTVTLTVKTTAFRTRSRQTQLKEPTDSTAVIFETALRLFEEIGARESYRLLGITVSGFAAGEGPVQLSLFTDTEAEARREKQKKLDAMADSIRERFGGESLVRGSLMKSGGKGDDRQTNLIRKNKNPERSGLTE